MSSEVGQRTQSSQYLYTTPSVSLDQKSFSIGQMHHRQDDVISLETHDEVNRKSFGLNFFLYN